MRQSASDRNHNGEIELESMLGKQQSSAIPVALADTVTRNGFVRKVYSILAVQLMITTFIAGCIVRHGRVLLVGYPQVVMTVVTMSCALSLLLVLVFTCCPDVMRTFPLNYGLLALFTVAESVMVGFACIQYTQASVLFCFVLTLVVVFGLTIYALRSKSDFTGAGPYLLSCLLILCGSGLLLSIGASLGFGHSVAFDALQLLYAAAGALVFSFFIIYDTQLIVGGGHEREFNVDDYAMAAISLYLDVIQLFLAILRLLGEKDDGGI